MVDLLNIRDLNTKEWTEEIYPYTEEMRDELRSVYGTENVRTISQEEYERSLIRRKQDEEFKEAVLNEEAQPLPEEPSPPTLEELRALRVKYFTEKTTSKQQPQQQKSWKHRLRPRKKH